MKRLPIERMSTVLRSACGGFSKLQYEQTGLSKLANHVAKKQPRFNGVCDLASMPQAQHNNLMAAIEVGEV